VKITNRTFFTIIKQKLEERKGTWAYELHETLWAYRMTLRTATGDTPYGLAFGSEVVIPVEIGSMSTRVQYYDPVKNDKGLKLSLDLIEEKREKASLTMAAYQQRASQYFNQRVRPCKFVIGDWVLRKVTVATKDTAEGKLAPKWEDPYKVVENHRLGAYHLENLEGKRLSHPWNALNLKKF
jgi:hypothetical protein